MSQPPLIGATRRRTRPFRGRERRLPDGLPVYRTSPSAVATWNNQARGHNLRAAIPARHRPRDHQRYYRFRGGKSSRKPPDRPGVREQSAHCRHQVPVRRQSAGSVKSVRPGATMCKDGRHAGRGRASPDQLTPLTPRTYRLRHGHCHVWMAAVVRSGTAVKSGNAQLSRVKEKT